MAENLKDKIAETFLEMTARKSFDKITIKDLVQECGISRQAFYYHFQDILDVIEWILQEGAKRLSGKPLPAHCRGRVHELPGSVHSAGLLYIRDRRRAHREQQKRQDGPGSSDRPALPAAVRTDGADAPGIVFIPECCPARTEPRTPPGCWDTGKGPAVSGLLFADRPLSSHRRDKGHFLL